MRQGHIGSVGGGVSGKIFRHNVFEKIISMDNLFSAWLEFKRGKSQKPDVMRFEYNLEDNLWQLHQELSGKTYQHSPYTPFYITDPKLRHIHKATVRDRVLHQAVFRVLYDIFDSSFIFHTYSSRKEKGTHRAVKQLAGYCKTASQNYQQTIFGLKCDVRKFFDSVNQKILLSLIKKKIIDENAIWLIEKIIKSFSKTENKGIPLGNVTSQLFANIYLNELDQFIKHQFKIRYYLRYSDDFIIIHKNKEYLEKLISPIKDFLKNILDLELHPQKVFIRKFSQGLDFLGYVVLPHYVVLRTKTKRRMLRLVNERNISSYLGILKHCRGYKLEQKIKTTSFLK